MSNPFKSGDVVTTKSAKLTGNEPVLVIRSIDVSKCYCQYFNTITQSYVTTDFFYTQLLLIEN